MKQKSPKNKSSRSMKSSSEKPLVFLGVDIAKRKFAAHLRTCQKELGSAEFANNAQGFKALRKWVEKHAPNHSVHACMEATGWLYVDLAFHLKGWAEFLAAVNPRCIKAFAESELRRNKNDRIDAQCIARFLAGKNDHGTLHAWVAPREIELALQELSRHIQVLTDEQIRLKNRLSSARTRTVKMSLNRRLSALNKEKVKMEKEIEELIASDAQLTKNYRLLLSIKGIGKTSAHRILAEVFPLDRFADARQLAAHAGVTPGSEQSGTSLNRNKGITRIGSSRLRGALYMPGLVAMKHNPMVQGLVNRLEEKKSPKKLIIIAVVRKLLHIIYGVLKGQAPFDPDYEAKRAALNS